MGGGKGFDTRSGIGYRVRGGFLIRRLSLHLISTYRTRECSITSRYVKCS